MSRNLRGISIFTALLTVLTSLSLIALMVMNIVGLNIVEAETPRTYWIQFQSEDRLLCDITYKRGEIIDVPPNPKHSEEANFNYVFRGWDLTGDNVPDIVPSYAYYSFLAVAVFQKQQVSSSKKSTSERITNLGGNF